MPNGENEAALCLYVILRVCVMIRYAICGEHVLDFARARCVCALFAFLSAIICPPRRNLLSVRLKREWQSGESVGCETGSVTDAPLYLSVRRERCTSSRCVQSGEVA